MTEPPSACKLDERAAVPSPDPDPLSPGQRASMATSLARTEPASGEDVRRALSDALSVGGHNYQPLVMERLRRAEQAVPAIVRRLLEAEAEIERLRLS